MSLPISTVVLALAMVCFPMLPAARQEAARQGAPPALTAEAMEEFLLNARILRSRDAGKGVTGSVRATLTDGVLTHDAHVQVVDESKPTFRGGSTFELNFRDSWKYNVAVYRIDRLLGLDLVPVSVKRRWRDNDAAYSWWVDDVLMDEGERMKKNILPPDPRCWDEQTRLVRMLDQLIDNADRNVGNMIITNNWRVWAIDHTRAFRHSKTVRKPAHLTGIDRTLLQRLEALEFSVLKREIGQYVTDGDIRSLLARRDAIVAHFKARGETALYDRRPPASGCLPSSRSADQAISR